MNNNSSLYEKDVKISIKNVFTELDKYFSKNDLFGAEKHLLFWENEAKKLNDKKALLEIYNEQIGLFRRLENEKCCMNAVNGAILIIDELFKDSVSVATVYINIATAFKVFNQFEKSLDYYEKAEYIYKQNNFIFDFKTAALYNNKASLFWDMKNYEDALNYYLKAIEILKSSSNYDGEIAVSILNIAHIYYEIDPFCEKVNSYLDEAFDYLNSENIVYNSNYAFICTKCAPSYSFFGQFLKAEELEKRAREIYEGN